MFRVELERTFFPFIARFFALLAAIVKVPDGILSINEKKEEESLSQNWMNQNSFRLRCNWSIGSQPNGDKWMDVKKENE